MNKKRVTIPVKQKSTRLFVIVRTQLLLIFTAFFLVGIIASPLMADNVSDTNKYAWSENAGWLNFKSTHEQVTVFSDHLEGYVWAENVGWIRLGTHTGGGSFTYANNSAGSYGVNNDGSGNLSGYGWAENVGWVNFNPSRSQVTINNATGKFNGYAWAENIGRISFQNNSPAYKVQVALAEVSLSSSTYDFGPVTVGSYADNTLTITNTGGSDLNLGALTPGDSIFSLTNDTCSNQVIAPGASCTATIRFTPLVQGAFNSSVAILSNVPGSPDHVIVSGHGNAPAVFLSTSHLSFSSQIIHTGSVSQVVTITDNGGATLNISRVTSDNTEFSILSDTCTGAAVTPGNTCTFAVQFTPTSASGRSGTISIISDSASTPDKITTDGTGLRPAELALSVSTYNFGDEAVGDDSDFTLTVTNQGGSDLNIGSLTSDTGVFTLANDHCSGQTIAAGSPCTVDVRFAPLVQGAVSAHISIPSNAASSPDIVGLSGNGTVPVVSLSIQHLSFGGLTVNSTSVAQLVNISNSGGAPLNITSVISDAAEFSISSDNCTGITVAPGNSCSFAAQFNPTQVSGRSGTISIVSNSTTTPDTVSVDGTGLSPASISLTAATHNFGNVTVGNHSDYTLTVTNSGGSDLNIGTLASDEAVFTLVSDNCSHQVIAASNTCTVGIRFTPIATGAVNGHISIPSNASTSSDLLGVSGHGNLPVAFLSASHLSFGSQIVNSASSAQLVTVTDNGGATLNVTTVTSDDAEFSIANDNCSGTAVTPGNSCTFEVLFTPNQLNGRSGTISLVSDSGTTPDRISVDGTGVTATGVTLSATTHNFGNVMLGNSSDYTLTFTNGGGSDLIIGALASDEAVFTLFSDNCSNQTIAASNTCTVGIRFTPIVSGAVNGYISIPSNASTSPDLLGVSGHGNLPVVFLSASHLSFGAQIIHSTSSAQLVTVTDNNGATLNVTTVTSDDAEFSIANDNCSGTAVTPGNSCTFEVLFTPNQVNGRSGTISIVSDSGTTPDRISVDGTGTGISSAYVTLSATTHNFGSITVGSSSNHTLTVTNTGGSDLNIAAITSDAADFILVSDNCSNQTIAASNTCTVGIRFAPLASGAVNAHISIPSNSATSPNIVGVSGRGDVSAVLLSPAHLSFGSQIVNSASVAQLVTIIDNGGASLNVTSVTSVNAEFSVANDNCSGTAVTPGNTCTFEVLFTPAQVNGRSGTISIVSDSATTPDIISVDGTGISHGGVTLSALSHNYGDIVVGVQQDYTLIVSNTGGSDLNTGNLSSDNAAFILANDTCSNQVIAAGNACTVSVRFAPTVAGLINGNISVLSDAASSPDVLAVSGYATVNASSGSPQNIPTLSIWGLILMTILLGFVAQRRID